MKQLTILIALLAFALAGCKKPENRTCWKFNGKEKTIEVPVAGFERLKLNGHIAYTLIQDSLDKVVITGGENMVNLITCDVSDGLLEITNKSRCEFLRNAKHVVKAEIHCRNIINIHYEGTEYLNSIGMLQFPYFTLLVRDGAGPVNLAIESQYIDADISHGWGDYTLRGSTAYARISARSNGYCDTYGLEILDSLYVVSDTPGTIKVRANNIPMRGYSKNSGDIWYQGTPSSISVVLTGEGEVVNKN